MYEIRNLNGKRVGDISIDGRHIEILVRGCVTIISANKDGTLKIEHQILKAE